MKQKIGNANDLCYRYLLYINPRYGDIAIMAKSNFFEKISCSTQESHVQETYNEMFKSVFKINTVDRKCQCDGYIDTRFDDTDISMLIEYKYDIRMKDKIERARVIAQCVGYLHKFEESGITLPKLVFIGDINECCIIHTNDLIKFLDLDCVNWDIAPCNLCQENNLIMPIVKSINPWVYDVDSNFKFNDIANKIISLCKGINQQVHITERNIEKIFNNFCKRVLKNANKIPANDLVAVFIGAMLDQEHYYKHPTKKNILIANGTNIAINGDEYDAFMNQHSTDYSPKEKRIFASISDRLIEDTNRRNKGEFYTPTLFVDYAHKMIEKEVGSHWKDNYVVWDPACGTKNLTRDYRFKELYCSTLEQAELDISKNYNKESTSFQFDFLNDSLDDLKVKAPGLLEAFELNKPIVFFLNPPYGSPGKSRDNIGRRGINAGCTATVVNATAPYGLRDLIAQFLYRIYYITKHYGLTNCVLAAFTKPTWLCGDSYKNFRSDFLNTFTFSRGILFIASSFAGVGSDWGITFNIWKPYNELKSKTSFTHDIVKVDNYSIITTGHKELYNLDDTKSASHWLDNKTVISERDKIVPGYTKSPISFEYRPYTKVTNDTIAIIAGALNNYLLSNIFYVSNHSKRSLITKSSLLFGCAYYAAVSTDREWHSFKDGFTHPANDNSKEFINFSTDSVVFCMFKDFVSLKNVKYGDEYLDVRNEFFWMSRQEMLDLAEEYNNDYTYEDALNSEERFVYLKLQEIKNDLSPEAKAVLDKATDLVKKSFKYREMFNESHPEYQINNWDCGFYQIKALLKEFMPDDLKEFRAIYKQLADKMRPMVYELGFLK